MAASNIGWTQAAWNPVTGCTRVSAGCDNCYAVRQSYRLEKMGQRKKYGGLTVLNKRGERDFNGVVRCHEDALSLPLTWKKGRLIFVNSMSDLFHKDVPFEFIDQVFAVMNVTHAHVPMPPKKPAPWHIYQLLTKRPETQREYLESRSTKLHTGAAHPVICAGRKLMRGRGLSLMNAAACLCWPLPNVWIGASVENQETLDERLPHLLACPAAVRWLSVEPMLERIDLSAPHLPKCSSSILEIDRTIGQLVVGVGHFHALNWVVIGCESKGAYVGRLGTDELGWRTWCDDLVRQCRRAGVPVFVKQIPHRGKVLKRKPGKPWPDDWPEALRVQEFPVQQEVTA